MYTEEYVGIWDGSVRERRECALCMDVELCVYSVCAYVCMCVCMYASNVCVSPDVFGMCMSTGIVSINVCCSGGRIYDGN